MMHIRGLLLCSLAAGTLTGLALGCAPTPGGPAARQLSRANCADVLANDVDKTKPVPIPDGAGVTLTGYRLLTWKDSGLDKGKWVAALSRASTDNPADSPVMFPGLKPGRSGCLYYYDRTDNPPLGRHADAFMQDEGNGAPRRLRAALICIHRDAHVDPGPTYESAADKCPEGAEAVGSIRGVGDDADAVIPLHFTVGAKGFEASLREALSSFQPGLAILARDALVNYLTAAGPWFPCSPYGCCRAF